MRKKLRFEVSIFKGKVNIKRNEGKVGMLGLIGEKGIYGMVIGGKQKDVVKEND